ncbi:hypothetical protein Tco_0600650 [Tanacetum coccineum]
MVLSKHQEARIKDLMRKSKESEIIPNGSISPCKKDLDMNKAHGASTPEEQNITIRFQQNPGECHWTAVKNILKYLRNTKDMFLVYGGNPEAEPRVDCYCDAGFETDRE